jgi:hypothetical protein
MSSTRLASFTVLAAMIAFAYSAAAGDPILRRVDHLGGRRKLGGITVSAKPVGGTVTTTVFTDEAGDY